MGGVISMLFALVVGAFAFVVLVYFLSNLGAELGIGAYLYFCVVWVGYGLLGSGISLFFEFGVSVTSKGGGPSGEQRAGGRRSGNGRSRER